MSMYARQSAAGEALYEKLHEAALAAGISAANGNSAIGLVGDAAVRNIVSSAFDAAWAEIALVIYHYEVVLASGAVKLDAVADELRSQIIGVHNQ